MHDSAATLATNDQPAAARFFSQLTAAASRRTGAIAAGVLLVVLTFSIYLPALHAGFVWDDAEYVTDNPTLRTFGGLLRIWLEPSALPQYYPLTLTTFWIEYHLWGLQPLGYHFVNILLHALNAVLLWRLLRRLRVPGAWLAAAIFAAHPIHVQSVAWITECKNGLSGLWVFSALLAFLRATAIDRPVPPANINWRMYGAACALFAAALLSKTTTCTLPVVLLLLAWWKRGTIEWRVVWLTVPLFALALLMAAATVAVEHQYVQGAEWTRSVFERGLVAGRSFWFYLHTLVWPGGLTFIYPRWTIDPQVWWQYLFPAAAGLVLVGLYLSRQRIGRGPLVAALCYACVLAPASGFFNLYFLRYSYVADHFAYLPSVSLIAVIVAAGTALVMRAGDTGRIVGAATCGVLVSVLGLLTARQCGLYQSPRALWTDTVAKNPESWLAQNNLGVQLAADGEPEAALEHYQTAARLQPSAAKTYLNIANLAQAAGRLDEAAKWYAVALRFEPTYAMAHYNLGVLLAHQGKIEEAISELTQAVRESPDFADAHNSLGAAYQAEGRLDRAIASYETALQLRPDSADAHYNLAMALSAQGQLGEAITHYETALRLRPNFPDVHVNLGNVLRAQGKRAQGIAHFEAALQLQPTHAEAHNALAVALAEQGQLDEAIAHLEQAVRAKPEFAEPHNNLGNALLSRGDLAGAIAQYEAALQLRPTYAEAQNNLGMALTAQGKTDAALTQFEQAVQSNPDLLQARRNLADALFAKGRYDEAVAQYEALLRAQPGNPEALRQLQAARSALQQ